MISVAVVVCASTPARADVLGHDRLRAHVDDMFAHLDVATLDAQQRDDLYASRTAITAGLFVPMFGSYRLEHQMFGELRPSAIVFDWVLGGLVPIGLGVTALVTSGRTRKITAYTALGLYAATRIGIIVIGNLHVSEYNRQVRIHLGAVPTSMDKPVPALVVTGRW